MCDLRTNCEEIVSLFERLHRRFVGLVKRELERLGFFDITSAQCIMLRNAGTTELTVRELVSRGCHGNSNVSYNLKKLVENGYLLQERSAHDRRSIHIRLTERGYALCERLGEMYRSHDEALDGLGILNPDLREVAATLRRLEMVWSSESGVANNQLRRDNGQ